MQNRFDKRRTRVLAIGVLLLLPLVAVNFIEGSGFFKGKDAIKIYHMDSVAVIELSVPEIWYQTKVKTGWLTTYTHASGIFLIRKDKYSNSLLFKRGDSANIFKFQYPDTPLQEASQAEWNNAQDEVSLYTKNNWVTVTYLLKEVNAIVVNKGISVSGEKVLSARVGQHFTDLISFTGEIRKGRGGILTGRSETFKGTAYLEVFSNDNKTLLSIQQEMLDYQTVPYHESIWYDSRTLIVPNDDLSEIIIANF